MRTYIETKINFGLKDYNNTFNKYKDYKNNKFQEVIEGGCFDTPLSEFQKDSLYSGCEHNLYQNGYYSDLIYKENKSKSDIRALKTGINNAMIQYLNYVVVDYCNNENEKKNFSIKLYLLHYEVINNIMKEFLINLICGTE